MSDEGAAPNTAPVEEGVFIAIVGPSGGGKDTLIRYAEARFGTETAVLFARRVVTRASDQSFNVRWTETRFVNGALDRTERWNAVVSIVQQTPRTEQRLRKNPLGIYVNGLSWSRELEGNEGAKP